MSTPVQIQTTIQAKKERVWDYYTNPQHITQWNFATPSWHCPKAENNLEVGGRYLARMEAKDGSFGFDFEAIYLEINVGRNFTYQLEDNRKVYTKFEEEEQGTKLTIIFDAEAENTIEAQRNGWQAILDNFKKYVEKPHN